MAWASLGWEPVAFSEIEPFPCALLAHHYPDIPNLGDVTKITEEQIKALGPIDLVVFGSPCQDLSVAGARKGFKDAEGNETRSGLFITAIRLIRWARQHNGCRFALWENVPGAFSSNKGGDFARVVGLMAGFDDVAIPKNGWGTEGAAIGDNGMLEWACLDAQWFGLAQRRKRVFAIVDFGDWSSRPPILLERHSLRGDTPPGRKAGKEITYDGSPCLTSSGRGVERVGDTTGQDPVIAYGIPGNWIGRKPENRGNAVEPMLDVAPCLTKSDQHGVAASFSAGNSSGSHGIGFAIECTPPLRAGASGTNQVPTVACFGGNNTSGSIDVSPAINAHGGSGRLDFESECFAVQKDSYPAMPVTQFGDIAGTPTSRHDSGMNVVAVNVPGPATPGCLNSSMGNGKNGQDIGLLVTGAYHSSGAGYWREGFGTLRARPQDSHENLIAFSCKDHGADAGPISPTLRSMNSVNSNQNAGGQVAVCFRACGHDGFTPDIIAPPICSSDGGGAGVPTTHYGMTVRRLTPKECERLQGFPDDFTLIPARGKPAADGPRYKALGNSMAVPVMHYIGQRIDSALVAPLADGIN
jgi:site-specific DNA-cytosine methylase